MKVKHYSLNEEKTSGTIKELLKYKLPLICYSPISYLLTMINSLTHKKKNFKYKASLCLIFKDEAPYLKEWIEYHTLIGIEHFYLYNNNSTDNYMEITSPYITSGIVTLIDFPEKYAQEKAYRDCYERTKNETEWLGYIDTDEYINLIKHDSIQELLDSVKFYPSLYLNWRMFGTSGHLQENPEELTIERYTQAWEHLSSTGKGFINNNFSTHEVSIHFHASKLFSLPVLGVMANKSLMRSIHCIFSNGAGEIAYINHYWSRSYAFYYYKDFVKGDVASESNIRIKKNINRFRIHELRNITKDFSIQRWLIFLKKRLIESSENY